MAKPSKTVVPSQSKPVARTEVRNSPIPKTANAGTFGAATATRPARSARPESRVPGPCPAAYLCNWLQCT